MKIWNENKQLRMIYYEKEEIAKMKNEEIAKI